MQIHIGIHAGRRAGVWQSCDLFYPNKAHHIILASLLKMSFRLFVFLVAVSVAGAVLDGSKVYKQSRTRLKTSSKAHHLELPPSLVNQFKASERGRGDVLIPVQSVLANQRSKRDDHSCGFDTSVELEISPVSGNL